eukprot:TRINITY_DN1029_c0_g1_i1.p1 TRINITY_DN1029_c0_g1~~TRINITY_DN1029_c0_g1_i1.p1  ORF type:complete len:677 (-),score=250.94 TRINITY_DN1029_c0_g1_i1:115-2145(-)
MANKEELSGWVATQHRTFTRWCNMVLAKNKSEKVEMQGLVHPNDFASGFVLMMLLETLVPGSKQFKSDHEKNQIKNPSSTRFVKLDAVSRALGFLKDHERLNLVNIGPTDIVDSNLKITLGFVWQLILKYQIADNSQGDAEAAKAAAKKNLLAWVNNLITPLGVDPVNNFGRDWNTGLALSALNEASYPELQDLDKCKVRAAAAAGRLENCREALNNAVNKMGLPKLIEPEDMAANEPDELSMMTLISVYKENITRIKGMRDTDLEAAAAAAAAKQRAEEEERRRREEEERRRREEEERRRREEEEARRKREEEERRRKAEEEEARRKAEEERRRREEEEARKRAEAEAARKHAEEEARRKAEEEEARRRAEEEARRRAEEEARRRQQQQQQQPPKKLFVMSFLSKGTGCYITAHDNGSVVCNSSVAKQWEYIIVEPLDHTGVPVRLRSWHGKYIHHNPDGTVSQYAPGAGPQTDIWLLTREPDQTCIIRTNDGGVLNADAGWGGSVICRQDDGSVNVNNSWRGTKIKAVNIRGYFGKFLSVSKKGEVKADQTNPGENETLTLERAPTANGPGKCYYLRSYHGKYVTAELKKGHVESKTDKPQDWEMWWFEKRGESRGVEGDAAIRSYHGKYLGVQKDSTFSKGIVEADRNAAGDWEVWTVFHKDLSRGKDSNVKF